MARVPVFAAVLPVSSTFNTSLPLPATVNAPWILFTTPPTPGARLPTLITVVPAALFTLAGPPVLTTFTVSLPAPGLIAVTAPVLTTFTVSLPLCVLTVVTPLVLCTVTVSLPKPLFTVVAVELLVDPMTKVFPPVPKLTFNAATP